MRHDKTQRAQKLSAATLELALIAPVLFLFLFCIIEFGWLFMARQMIHHAAAEAADLAVLPGYEDLEDEGTYDTELELVVEDLLVDLLSLTADDVTFDRNSATSDTDPCEVITVTVPTSSVLISGYLADFDFVANDIEFSVTNAHPNFIGVSQLTCAP